MPVLAVAARLPTEVQPFCVSSRSTTLTFTSQRISGVPTVAKGLTLGRMAGTRWGASGTRGQLKMRQQQLISLPLDQSSPPLKRIRTGLRTTGGRFIRAIASIVVAAR